MSGVGRHRRSAGSRRKSSFAGPPPNKLQRLRAVAAIVVVVAGLAIIAAWFGPRFLDWGQYRTTVEAVASAALGRPVRIAGPIRLSLLPQATLVAGDVTLADTGDGASATAAQLRLRVALSALLSGRIEPEDLVLRGPHMRLPWPLTTLVTDASAPPPGLHARVEDGTLAVGGLMMADISGELRVDPATGTLSAAGLASVMGRSWQMTGRLGRRGRDGSATLEVSLDGKGTAVGTGGTLSGQIAADGSLAGRLSGRGPDLSLLLPAPNRPWRADGQVKASSGLVIADDLELDIGGAPARGAVAVRLLPQLHVDAALATSQLDLDAWLAPLLQGHQPTLPTGIELSADAAQLAGGVLRHFRTGFEVGTNGVTLREAEAVLPGNATFHLTGQLAAGRFAGDARLVAPNMAQTLAWLRPRAPALVDALPPDAVQSVTLNAAVAANANEVAFGNLVGDLNGAPLSGSLAIGGGARPVIAANLQLTGPVLDRWVPSLPVGWTDAATRLAALPQRFAGFDADITLAATAPVFHGTVLGKLTVEAKCGNGMLDLHHFALTATDLSLGLSGNVSAAGKIGDGRLDVSLGHAEALAEDIPPSLEFARTLFTGPATLGAMVNGTPAALSIMAAADLSDTRLQVNGTLDLAARHWKGPVALHHPGAPRLLGALGLSDTMGWLGNGSLSVQAGLDAAPDHVALSAMEMSAGSLRMTGDAAVAGLGTARRNVTAKLDADTLPLPAINPQSTAPWSLDLLHAADAAMTVRAAHVLSGQMPVADQATATIAITNGVLRLDGVSAKLAGGTLSGHASLDASTPPTLAATARLADIVVDGPLTGAPVDLVAGRLDGTVDLTGTGYSPAGLLATLKGGVRLTVRDGTLAGLDAGRVLAVLNTATTAGPAPDAGAIQAGVADALRDGGTPFTLLTMDGMMTQGTMSISRGDVATPAGAIAATGTVDLPGEAIDAHLAIRPALEKAPSIGLRIIGPVASPSRSPELADLARWLADR
ncbi:AsmA family protein [Acidisphaera sp. L21]|uniref:AsmA family protein n=1 Tax=Acidisphaera sp. L21 TaxID=1641851 RepID=UPI00131E75F6|nr:AsmA family protein [Acidisphaera sp. L21]